MKLILLTGFLGAGKTTLLSKLLTEYKDHKIGVLMNEFGDVGIDGKLIEDDHFQLTELNNGSIFCACLKENFILGLAEFLKHDLEYVFVESSGVADPSNMGEVLETVEKIAKASYDYLGSICVVDGLFFLQQYELVPALHRQIYYADSIVINKVDLQNPGVLEKIKNKIREINAEAPIIETSYCQFSIDEQLKLMEAAKIVKPSAESGNTRESRFTTKVVKTDDELDFEQLQEFLKRVVGDTHRLKGFAKTNRGVFEISGVNERYALMQWDKPVPETEIVMISSIGIGIISTITAAWKQVMGTKKMNIV